MVANRAEQSKALANAARLSILQWLTEPNEHFSHQMTGDPRELGVCVTLLTEKLGMAQPTVSRHLEVLARAGFVTVRRVGRWSFYARDAAGLAEYKGWINENV